MPWPSTCWIRLSPAAMPPVIARCAMARRTSRISAERARPSAVKPRELPHEPQARARTRTACRPRARGLTAVTIETRCAADETSLRASCVERRHQFALGQPHQIGAVDDVADMAFQRGARPRQPRSRCASFDRSRTIAAARRRGRRWRSLSARAEQLSTARAAQARSPRAR